MESWDAQKMLDKYLYDYLVKKGCPITAQIFAVEANVADPQNVAIESPEGFLKEWWDIFYEKHCSNQGQSGPDPYFEAAQNIYNFVYHIPSAVPASSPHSAIPVQNISHMVPSFLLRTPEDEAMFDLRFLEMDHPVPSQMVPFVTDSRFLEMDHPVPSQMVPFVTDSSYPMEQSPKMPQQWEAKDEGEGLDIHLGKTMQMEPNADASKRAMLPVPDPSEAEENNACQQVFNQGWSLSGVGTAAPAIDYQLSSPSSAFFIIVFGSGSSLCSFLLFVCSQGVGPVAPAIDYPLSSPSL